ncbi:SGNH/GDSL hydrolase family protein [Bacillus sp. V2I10]|uniref:SGNH/GDSL hydrolase family protein n=1 Tax=Bacillus sp. V2I10 TaxID=3042276 RepID=UPI0027849890|nr:SGNH/GDSL hydrolase family protein [Bacillus sp. V2I10]MDQ0858292.1 lysophospholipase L1-like esterase [Bacillus sp. V2I10]
MKKYLSLAAFLVILLLMSCGNRSERYTIVAFGDSNTRGANWTIRNYQDTDKWVNLIKSTLPVNNGQALIHNAGVGGETTEDARKRFKRDVLKMDPNLVFIMFGTNDAVILPNGKPKVDHARFKENLLYYVREVRHAGGTPVLMTCLPIVEGKGNDKLYYTRYPKKLYAHTDGARNWHNSYNDITREVAYKNDVTLIDNWTNMVKFAGGDSDEALLNSGIIDPSGNHMTPQGAELIYLSILESKVLNSK